MAIGIKEQRELDALMEEMGFKPQKPNEPTGILEGFKRGYVGNAAGTLCGQLDFTEANLGIGGEWGDSLNEIAQENARRKEYSISDMLPFASDYYTNGEGLAYDIGSPLGSMTVLGGETAAAGALASAAGIGSIGGLATTLGGRAAAAGMPKLASALGGRYGTLIVGKGLSTVPELASEGGGMYRQGIEKGMSADEALDKAWQGVALEAPFLTASNLLEGGGLGLLAEGAKKQGAKGIAANVTKAALAGAGQQAYEEGTQQQIANYVTGDRPDIDSVLGVYSPLNWQEDEQMAATAAVPFGALAGGGGSALGEYRGRKSEDESIPGNIVSKAKNIRPMPVADGIEDSDLSNTNPELVNGVNELNAWVYDNFGKDLVVSGGARSRAHNAEVNGAENSHHLYGTAIDVDASNLTEEELAAVREKAKEMGFNADGEDMYHDKGSGYHMHLNLSDGAHVGVLENGGVSKAENIDVMRQFLDDNQYLYDADTNNAIAQALESNDQAEMAELYSRLAAEQKNSEKGTNTGAAEEKADTGDFDAQKNMQVEQEENVPLLQANFGNLANKVRAGQGAKPVFMKNDKFLATQSALVKKLSQNSTMLNLARKAFAGDKKSSQIFKSLRPEVQEVLSRLVKGNNGPAGQGVIELPAVAAQQQVEAVRNNEAEQLKQNDLPSQVAPVTENIVPIAEAAAEPAMMQSNILQGHLSNGKEDAAYFYGQKRAKLTPGAIKPLTNVSLMEQLAKNDKLQGIAKKALAGDARAARLFNNLRPDVQTALRDIVSGMGTVMTTGEGAQDKTTENGVGVNGEGANNKKMASAEEHIDNGERAVRRVVDSSKNVNQRSKADFSDSRTAEDNLLKALGLERQDENSDKVFNVVDDSDAALEIALKDLKGEMNKLSSNPVFNPDLHKAAFKVGMIYLQRGANNFADWSHKMVEAVGEKIRPWLGSVWRSIETYPKNEKLDPAVMSVATDFVGAKYNEGMHTAPDIYRAFVDIVGAEKAAPYKGLIDSAFAGVDELYNPTLNVQESEPTAENITAMNNNEGVKDNGNVRIGTGKLVERIGKGPDTDGMGRYDEGGVSSSRRGRSGGAIEEKGRDGHLRDSGVSDSSSVAGREIGDSGVQAEKSVAGDGGAGDIGLSRSVVDSFEGMELDRGAGRRSDASAEDGRINEGNLQVKNSNKKEADRLSEVKRGLPFLTNGQAEDVIFAEKRLKDAKKTGVLFANGTGTGKTFSGLGIAKELVKQGKSNLLVVTPTDQINVQWINAAREYFDIELSPLTNSHDAGKGAVITTYANMQQNDAIVKRDWDLVIADESHNLMNNEKGEVTGALKKLRAITLNKRGFYDRAKAILRTDEEKRVERELDKLNRLLRKNSADKDLETKRAELQAKLRELSQAHAESDRKAIEEWKKIPDSEKPKTVFLSATPFAYDKNIDYAEGYLFNYPESDGSGYNIGDGREQFMMQHFGYSMRYNKLTRPDAQVDNRVMEVQFHEWLKKEGALSGRQLDIDKDYNRGFLLVGQGVGKNIDEGFNWLQENHVRYPSLREFLTKQFNGRTRNYMIESIKAREVVPIVKEYLQQGKKVVLFHDTNKPRVLTHPFKISTEIFNRMAPEERGRVLQEYDAFKRERPDLVNLDLVSLRSPIEILQSAFGDELMLFNGDIPKNKRRENVREFNDDDGKKRLILVQADAGNAGISLHDTTGKHQRVLINLGIPKRPSYAIQIEGRIYRQGSMSNAIIRYLSTGMDVEKRLFAGTIASRASTAENLALGNQARGLRDSFVNAFLETMDGSWEQRKPGAKGEDVGGKEYDRATLSPLSDFDRAKSLYFANQKKNAGNKAAEGKDYFATPEPVGFKMVEWAGLNDGDKVLEPSAGHGAISRFFSPNTENVIIEPSGKLAALAQMNTDGAKVINSNFEDYNVVNKFTAVVMNPPFGVGGKTAMDHVAKAFKHLRDDGRIIAIIPDGPSMTKRFDRWYNSNDAADACMVGEVLLPSEAFKRAGTGIFTKILVIDKHMSKDRFDVDSRKIDLRGAKDINDLFDRIENLSMPERAVKAVESVKDSNVSNAIAPTNDLFAADVYTHTKTGEKLYRAMIKERVSADDYRKLNLSAKNYGGYYSKFAKGFLFNDENARNSFIDLVSADSVIVEKNGIIAESRVLYDQVLDKYSDIANGNERVRDSVERAIKGTLDFGTGKGELQVADRGGAEKNEGRRGQDASAGRRLRNHRRISKTLGIGITRALVNDGAFSLNGRTVKSLQDLAEYAQVLRHPGYEKFHRVYVNADGVIIGHETVSCMLPSEARIWEGDDARLSFFLHKKKINSDAVAGVYYIHNHPSTIVTPSNEDVELTRWLGSEDAAGDKFKGHIILDTTEYAVLNRDGQHTVGKIPDNKQIKYDLIGIPHKALGVKLSNVSAVARAVKTLDDTSTSTAFVTDTKLKVRAVVQLPNGVNSLNEDALNRYLRWIVRSNYGAQIFVSTADEKVFANVQELVRKGRVVDAVLTKDRDVSRGARDSVDIESDKTFFGIDPLGVDVKRVLEKTDDYEKREFSIRSKEGGELLTPEQVLAQAKRSIPNGKNFSLNGATVSLDLPNGRKLTINLVDEIVATPEQLAKASAEHEKPVTSSKQLQGSMRTVGLDGIIELAKDSEGGTIDHEVMEFALQVALNGKQKHDLEAKYKSKEAQCDAYRDWQKMNKQGKGTAFGKLWRMVQNFADQVKALFGSVEAAQRIIDRKAKQVFENVASGEVWNRDSAGNPKLGSEVLREDALKWQKTIKDYVNGIPLKGPVYVMQTPIALELAGAKHLPIKIDLSILSKVLLDKHKSDGSMNEAVLAKVPVALTDPMLIYQADDVNGKKVLVSVLELEDVNGDNVIVPLILSEYDNRYVINKIQTAYGKEALKKPNSKWLADRLNGDKLRYLNREKTTAWSQSAGLQLPLEVTHNSGLSISSIPTEQDLVKQRLNYPERYSAVAKTDDISYSVRIATENLEKNLRWLVGRKPADERITVKSPAQSKAQHFGILEGIVRSPGWIAEKYPQFKAFFKMSDRAMQVQEEIRSYFDRAMNRIHSTLKSDSDQQAWSNLLLQGDIEGKEYSKEELRQQGISDEVVQAYARTRSAIRKAYTLLNDARKQVRTYQKNMSGDKLRELRKDKFVEILKVEDAGDQNYLVAYKMPKVWTKRMTVDADFLNSLKEQDTVQIVSDDLLENGSHAVVWRERMGDLTNRSGYIPHFFHDYFIMKKNEDGSNTVVGSGRTVKDAMKKAEAYLEKQPDANLVIAPKSFSFGDDEKVYAAVVGDTEYQAVLDRVMSDLEMSVTEAREFLQGKVKTRGRHRWFGNFKQRKGADGFETDMNWLLKHYFNATGRYVALEEFKPAAIGLFERYFGAFDKDYSDNPLAHYTKQYINDMNGNPSALETQINNLLNRSDWYRKHIASNFGERAALQMANSVTGKISVLKLGFLNISSALLNLSQLINTVGLLGEFTPVAAGMKNALINPSMTARKIYKETGIMNDITLDTTSGYGKFRPGNVAAKTMYLFRTVDMFARKATVLAAYHSGKNKGMNHEQAINYAKEINRKANFDYGVADAPNVFRRGSIFGQIALQFKKYPIKELELMHELVTKGSKAQNAKFWGTYFLLCGLLQVPMSDWLDDIWKEIFGDSPKTKIKKMVMEAAGDDPVGKELAKIALYGLPSISPLNVDISNRAGVGDVTLAAENGISGVLGGATLSTAQQLAKAIAAGDTLASIKALSPALGNYMQAVIGHTEGRRARKNSELDTMYDQILKATGFRNVDESIAGDMQGIIASERSAKTNARQRIMDSVIAKQTAGEKLSAEDIAELKRLGVTGKQLRDERNKKRMEAKDRMQKGMSKRERAENQELLKFLK